MTAVGLLVVLGLAAATLLAVAVLTRVGTPAPVVLVLAGLAIGFLPFVPDVSLDPHVVLLGVLPLLVYHAAGTSSLTSIARNARSIGVLGVPLVLATALAVGAVAHWVGGLPWATAFVLGTAVAPTDAAAATAIARRIGLPRRLVGTLDGEALFNDATALVLYGAAVAAATTGHFSLGHTAAQIAYAAVVGCLIGGAVGWVGRRLRERVDEPAIEIAGSIIVAYAAYLPAEAIHASGVLAAVCVGLYLGWHTGRGPASAASRLQSESFWHTLVFLVDAGLFVLVGLSFHAFTAQARDPVGRLTLTAAAVVAAVILLRLVWTQAFPHLVRAGAADGHAGHRPWADRLVLGWSGMRGAITLAAILAVPQLTETGHPLPGREDVVYLGFAVIFATLLLQGLTLPALIRRVGLSEHPAVAQGERRTRVALARATLAHLDAVRAHGEAPDELAEGLRAQYRARLRHLEGDDDGGRGDGEAAATLQAELRLRAEITALERSTLRALRDAGQTGGTTSRVIERELDLQDATIASLERVSGLAQPRAEPATSDSAKGP